MTSRLSVTAYFAPTHMICRVLLPRPFTPKAVLLILVLLSTSQPWGRDFGDTVEVTAGLSPQDKVIDSPSETLQAGDTVQVPPPPPSAPATQAATPGSPSKATP
jgi:hypothetical protein